MARSPRAAARRTVIKRLSEVKRRIQVLQVWWDAPTTVFVTSADRQPGDNAYRRDREPGEYPEAQRMYWASTVKEIDGLMVELSALREHALTEYHATPEQES